MTKKEFIKKVIEMERPEMSFKSDSGWDLLSTVCIVRDAKNKTNSFVAFACRLSSREYHAKNLNDFYKRDKANRLKFENWLYDACGNYCTVKNSTK